MVETARAGKALRRPGLYRKPTQTVRSTRLAMIDLRLDLSRLKLLSMPTRQDVADLIVRARRVVAFTGAGISTESGIPDFRSPGGVWSQMKPISFQEFVGDIERRREAWDRVFSGRAGWTGREPNAGHRALGRLANLGSVITQNVDNLHQAAGLASHDVIELHGNAGYANCLVCVRRYEFSDLQETFLKTREPPVCVDCGGLVKSATISFGQQMPAGPMAQAEAQTLNCDLFLVLGSSLVVYPAAEFPRLAKRNGAALVIINREPTDQDQYADLVLHDELGPALSEIID